MAKTPTQQHEAMASKILARRAKHAQLKESSTKAITDETPTPVEYEDMDKEELRVLCKSRGIKFKKKDTNETLIDLLDSYDDLNDDDGDE